MNYMQLIRLCRKYRVIDRDRYTVLEWRLKRRWKRELRRRGLR